MKTDHKIFFLSHKRGAEETHFPHSDLEFQVGDEVVVAFNHGDVREPYILGSVWNGQDDPPSTAGDDAVTKRIIKTQAGHKVEFDDAAQTITITSSSKHTVTIGPDSIVIATSGDASKATLDAAGNLKLEATVSIEIKAPSVKISGTTVEVTGDATAKFEGQGMCTIKGGMVAIN